MNTFEITQSLNWYKSNVMTMDKYGKILAYGSRSIIVLVKGVEGNSVYDLQYYRLKINSKMGCGRIGAVSFSHPTDTHEDAVYLAAIDEVNIYIWKVTSLVCEHIHSFGNKKNKNITLMDVGWLYGSLNVIAMSDAGILHKWDIQALTMRNYTLDIKLSPLTLAACPHKQNLIAIGCKNGHIVVYDLTGDGQIVHKLHYHERNIVSLAWCPVPYSPLSSDHSTQPLLLASTACDRTGLYICRAGSDMYNETTVSLSMKPMRKTIFKNKTNLIWSCIKWIKPSIIILTSAFGEIIKVELKPEKIEPIVSLFSDSHKDVIFSMACPSESDKPYLWSSCMGRKLIRTPLFDTTNTGEIPLEIPTLGGFVYCFALSPVNSADFAFGLGDGRIYYWNVTNNRQLELNALGYSIDSKVLSLAFHPFDEGLLAYGTGDGRVGIFNLTKKRNNVNLLKTILAHPIYRLCWAPLPNSKLVKGAKLALYAVGNGQVIIYNDTSLFKDPHNLKEYVQFNEIEDKLTTPVKRIEMAWKPDHDVVAIGNSNGSIYLLDGDTLKLKHVVNGHDQSVECIIWHPTHVTCDYSEESKYKNYFASSSHCIRVHQLDEDGKPLLVVEFKGHKEKINELAWSPHKNLMLLSCSNDFTAKVWDVEKCTLIGVYSKHLCTVLCGMFSPLDRDIVFTGSADHSVHSWRVSKDLENEITSLKKNIESPNVVKEKIISKDMENSKNGNTDSSKEPKSKIQQFPSSSSDLFLGKYLEKAVDNFIDSNYYGNKISENDSNKTYLAFFGTSEEMKQLLVEESNVLKKKNQMIPYINNVNMWGQNLEGYFKDAIETKSINDWMISVSPSVSYELWTQMCNAYAGQLEDVGEITKASTYLVALKKFKEAALMLLKYNLFREALAITKSQEQQDNEVILEITKKWAEYNVTHGHPKEAAHCYLGIGDVRNAVFCLTKVKQTRELLLAAKLARYLDEDIEESLIVNLLKTEYFKHHKWNEAREILKNHPKLDYLNMWVGVHEEMFKLDPKVTYKMFKDWICGFKIEENFSVIDSILKHVECKPEYYARLIKTVESKFVSDTALLLPKMTVFIAGQFCLIALQYQKTGLFTVDSQMCLIKCLVAAYNYESAYSDSKSKFGRPLSRLIMWIFPKGPLALDLYSNFEFNDNLMKSIRAYLGYTCFSWFKPLYISLNKKIYLAAEENTIDEEKFRKTTEEMIVLTRQFRQLFEKYIFDIMDIETTVFFKAKKEIERINQLLTTTNPAIANIEDSISEELNGYENSTSLSNCVMESILEDDETSLSSLSESIQKCDIVGISNNNCSESFGSKLKESNHCCTNNISTKICQDEIEKCKIEVHQFIQYLELELKKFYGYLNDQPVVKHVAHLEIEASKKKDLELVVAEFENKRINSPDPFLLLGELKTFIRDFDRLSVQSLNI